MQVTHNCPLQRHAARRSAALAGAIGAVMITAAICPSSHAAVRTCTARLTSAVVNDATEQGAKTKAISDWALKAKGAGIENPAWRIAAGKRLECKPVTATGAGTKAGFECRAIGHACTILQVAPPAPPAAAPSPSKKMGVDT